jgi:peptide/nickel transport system ATP-binding protein
LLSLQNLTIHFPHQPPAVNDLSFTLAQGGQLGILGLSGSGKSLTALALLGLLPGSATVSSGVVMYTREDGSEVDLLTLTEKQWREFRGREISLVFQEPLTALNPVHRVEAQLMEAVESLCPQLATKAVRQQHLKEWLDRVELGTGQERILKAYPHELSGGQRQRLLIALALLGGPRLLIADEPTTALDTITEAGILRLLDKLRLELGMTMIFITHDLDVLRRTTARTLVLRQGEMVHSGTTEEVLALPGAGLTDTPKDAEVERKRAFKTDGQPFALSVIDLMVNYSGKRDWPWSSPAVHPAVRGVSFVVGAGEWVALAGPSGCGKTTVARCLAGLLTPSDGEVLLAEKGNVQLVFQDPFSSLNPSHSLKRILEEVLRLRKYENQTAEELLAAVGLGGEGFAQRKPSQLSGGQRQRVAIARALAARPTLLIADEAVSALDVPLRADILDLLDHIRQEKGIGLLFITHDLRLVAERADRVLIMEDGLVVEEGNAKEVCRNPKSDLGRALMEAGGL